MGIDTSAPRQNKITYINIYVTVWVGRSTARTIVSKTIYWGSNPCRPAKMLYSIAQTLLIRLQPLGACTDGVFEMSIMSAYRDFRCTQIGDWKSNPTIYMLSWTSWLSWWPFKPQTRVQSPPRVPNSNNWNCQNIEALILHSLLRGTTTIITITNKLFLGQPRG